jgi:hypothetical protein
MLHGLLSELSPGDVVQVYQVEEEDLNLDVDECTSLDSAAPPEIQYLLSQYAGIFDSKVSFPPPRSWSHSIPLVPGASTFHIRPYRYPPTLKD